MYEGIFEDVQAVKEILASHGHKSVDETLVFELLEDLKVKEQVVKILLGTGLRPNLDSPTCSLRSGSSNNSSQEEAHFLEPDDSLWYSDSCHSSDGLEILEDSSYKAAPNEPVDLTMEENQPSPNLPIVQKEAKTEDSVVEIIVQESDKVGAREKVLINLTENVLNDGKECPSKVDAPQEEQPCVNDNSGDVFDAKNEDVDATNSATESEDVEMDDYYIRPDLDSEDSVGFGGSDGKISIPPSPISRMQDRLELGNFENRNNEASNLEPADPNRMEEMLEENNNDPNNNLEDIQVMEQNNVSSTMVDNSNSIKEITTGNKCVSPKPGCSKDSYYTEFNIYIGQGSDKLSYGTFAADNKSLSSADSDKADRLENQSSFCRKSPPTIDEKMTSDFGLLKKVLPNVCSSYIWASLRKNQDAINRIELVLWDLLPDERPHPILSAKRKQESDNSLSPMKKFVSNESQFNVNNVADFPATIKLPQAQPNLHEKSRIIKPAKLSIPQTKTNIVHPPNLASFSEYRSSPTALSATASSATASSVTASSAKSSNSTVKLKPSSLQFLDSKKPKLNIPHDSQRLQISGITSTQDKRVIRPSSIPVDTALKKKSFLTIQSLPSVIVRESENNLANLNPQMTGAIPKNFPRHGTKHSESGSYKQKSGTVSSASGPSSSGFQHQAPGVKAGLKIVAEAKLPGKEPLQQSSSVKHKPEMVDPFRELLEEIFPGDSAKHNQIGGIINYKIDKPRKEDGQPSIKALEKPVANPATENVAAAAQNGPKFKEAVKIGERDVAPPRELFNPLINMFPDVDPAFIADLCIDAQLTKKNLESLVEVLLVRGLEHPRIFNPEPEPLEINPDVQYENLQGIFPDAHPEYLRKMAERYYNDPEAMKNFVQAQLEKPDYPTMADYLKRIKITEQIRQYTVDFSAEKFLEIFPSPFKHFEDPKRVYNYNVIAFEFLKCHFRGNKVATILKVYRHTKPQCHLSLAAKELERIGPDMKSRRSDKFLPTEDIPLLQEFAFLQHKAEIKAYMKEQKLKEKAEFRRLKDKNELVECQCCFDGECMPSKCSTCSEGHIFCKSCIKLGTATKIGDGQTQFPCFVDCKGEFTLPVLQNVLEPTTFSILLRKRQEEEVKAAGLEGLVSCPFCHFASIPPPEDKVFKCLNPECMKESCRLCKELNHVPLRCDELTKGEEARHYLEEKMTEALVRKCYKCSRPFFKDEGCNKMTCPCGATTCYICGQRVKDYTHFNGQGSDRVDLCPLWSDNKVLNAQTVRVVAEAAEKEILKNNPRLKIDAKALMPALPQASKGPHQDIANAHILPVHTRRA